MRRFESLDLTIPQMFFRRRVTVEASEQQSGPFHVIARDVGIFDLPWQTTPGGRLHYTCLLYTSDAADERSSVDLGGRRIIKKKKKKNNALCARHQATNSGY